MTHKRDNRDRQTDLQTNHTTPCAPKGCYR